MKLRHYTNSKESAVSIIKSKQMWLGKTGEALKDRDEVNHYINIFRLFHSLDDIVTSLNKKSSHDSKVNLYENMIKSLFITNFYSKNRIMIGDIFADVIRNESYIICFTEDNESNFHESKYGPVSFLFSDNPLLENKYEDFRFLTKQIIYIDSKEFINVENELEEFYEKAFQPIKEILNDQEFHQMLIDIHDLIKEKFDKKESKTLRKELIKNGENLKKNTLLEYEIMTKTIKNFHEETDFDVDKVSYIGGYLESRINKVREDRILSHFEENLAKHHRLNGTFRQVQKDGHERNIISCFLKDIIDKDDNETRIIALPVSRNTNLMENKLKVDLDMSLLKEIIVSNSEDKENTIKEIKSALEEMGLEHVIVK